MASEKKEIPAAAGESNDVVLFAAPTNCVDTAKYIFGALTRLTPSFKDGEYPFTGWLDAKGQNVVSALMDVAVIDGKSCYKPRGRIPIEDLAGRSDTDAVFYVEVHWGECDRHVIVYAESCVFHSYFGVDGQGNPLGHGPMRLRLEESDRAIFDTMISGKIVVENFLKAFARICVPPLLRTKFVSSRIMRCVRSWKNEGLRLSKTLDPPGASASKT